MGNYLNRRFKQATHGYEAGVARILPRAGRWLLVYGVIVAGWASNSKYAFLGALRASAQMVSYEIPLILSTVTVVMIVDVVPAPFVPLST